VGLFRNKSGLNIALGRKSGKIIEIYAHIMKKSWDKINNTLDYLGL
jgi:hypothetical protein